MTHIGRIALRSAAATQLLTVALLLVAIGSPVNPALLPIDAPAAPQAGVIAVPADELTTLPPPAAAAASTEPGAEYRLPLTVHPEHYKLEVITHLNDSDSDGYRFSGRVWIKIICDEDTTRITLHSRHLNINESSVTVRQIRAADDTTSQQDTTAHPATGISYDGKREFMHIDVAQSLRRGATYELFIAFDAPLAKGLHGYYMSSYFDRTAGRDVFLSVTQFEATNARQALPCFDEPAFKARFEIILGHHDKYRALSNMPIARSEPFKNRTNWTWDFFDITVPMSTYLVAYSINDFEYREAVAPLQSSNVTFRIWARRDAINQVDYALAIGPKCLRFYENYFDVAFPLPKMDMMAVPDFSAGAMENWGLVTYRETLLLYSPDTSSSSNKHAIASVVAHELAHQWFGNLVTMRWWDDLWLNEGFATYVASLGVHALHPEWNSFAEESLSNTLSIFSFDALRSSHPVKVQIDDPATISQIFDSISYKKGSTILRMMHRFLGEQSFQRGVHNYLVKHAYGNAVQDNLWQALTEEAHRQGTLPATITVKQIMDKWTLQTGYPKVTVERNYELGEAKLTQKRYLARTLTGRTAADEQCWWVPLSYTTATERNFNDTRAKDWLDCAKETTNALSGNGKSPTATTTTADLAPVKTLTGLPGPKQWVLFNIDMSGLYKVQYDRQNWQLLIDQLNGPEFQAIGTVNRAQLIDDAMELAWTGDLNYTIALPLLRYLEQEEEYLPWVAALANLDRVSRQLKRTPKFGQFRAYMRRILTPIYGKLGGLNTGRKAGDSEDVVKQKVQVAGMSCRYNVGDCVDKSIEYFRQWMLSEKPDVKNDIPIDLRKIVYCTAMRNGGDVEWNFLWQRYQHTQVASVRDLILRSLGCTREVWLLSRYLELSLNETSGIRTQDAGSVFGSVAAGEVGFFVAQTFFEQNIDAIYAQHSTESSRLSRYVTALASQMKTAEEAEHLKEFTSNRTEMFAKSSKGIQQALEVIEVNRLWHDFNYDDIGRYLKDSPADEELDASTATAAKAKDQKLRR